MRFSVSILLHIILIGIGSVLAAEECSASKSCEIGCCSKFGFCGLGPNFCVNNCEQKAECDPGDFGKQYSNATKCPLNVCCSRHGFCGTTKDFCGNKKVKRPSCSINNQGFGRVVGYYEGWSSSRPCNTFYPEQLPVGVYTHLNYAFASIDPETFKVITSLSSDIDMYKRLTNLKRADPDLKVFIAIGGWTFNDPGPTATTFSDIARSESNTNRFAASLISFMSTYNFDGVDLDWEYPGAHDRSGRDEDYKNFPVFLRRLKSKLKASGRDGVSLTLPASFWYLQHFDIEAIQRHVDFFNIMSYDLHGTWDQGNKWVGSYLNAHTNLTEITQALDLLWRNKLSPDKVVLGLAFYGRAFTVANTGCTKPGCTYASGGKKRRCSHEVSVILNSEIDEVLNSTKAKPILYKTEAVKVLNYESNQWVAYDDAETLKLKADFARGQCLGGLMVWAVSHDTKDARYTEALAKAANRKFVAALPATKDSPSITKNKHAQCKWTNCAESCPSGWLRVRRSDDGARKDEYMTDETGCNGVGFHQLCCPPAQEFPKCGWYDHNNGNCGGKCPSGTFEIGSLSSKYCNAGTSYEAACCSNSGKSTQLYSQCSWGSFPDCDSGKCASGVSEVTRSMTGSGGAWCDAIRVNNDPFSNRKPSRGERKYCCRDSSEDQRWTDCEWENHIGVVPKKFTGSDYCLSGCPSDKVRVAMESNSNECSHGYRAKCCTPAYSTVIKTTPKADQELQDALEVFLDDPVCTNNTQSHRYDSQETVISRLRDMIYGSTKLTTVTTWDNNVGGKYKNLKYQTLSSWAHQDEYAFKLGSTKLPESIVCQLSAFNRLIGGSSGMQCYIGRSDRPKSKRSSFHHVFESAAHVNDGSSVSSLHKRDDQYTVRVWSPLRNSMVILSVWGISYPKSGEWHPSEPIWDRILDMATPLCSDASVDLIFRIPGNNDGLVTEHIFEKQGLLKFIASTISGVLPSRGVSKFPPIDPSFWEKTAFNQFPTSMGLDSIGDGEMAPIRRMFTRLGGKFYRMPFVLAGEQLNGFKERIWEGSLPRHKDVMAGLLNSGDLTEYMDQIRFALGAIVYTNHPVVNSRLVIVLNWLRLEMEWAEILHFNLHPTAAALNLVGRWDEFIGDYFDTMALNVQKWAHPMITTGLTFVQGQTNNPFQADLIGYLATLMAQSNGLRTQLRGVKGQP